MRLRNDLYMKSFIQQIFEYFSQIDDPTEFKRNSKINLSDCLMSCFALFNLKWPSLLQYDQKRLDPIIKNNLKS